MLTVVLFYGNAVAEGVAQEKGGRVMEVLLSRVRAQDLLAGKIVGLGVVGLVQMLLAGIGGVAATLAVKSIDVPTAVPATLAMTVLWFTLGYAFWSVLFAAGGALVSRVEDLQSVVLPLTWILVVCAMSAVVVQEAPDAWYMRVASVFPLTSPFVMPVRAALGHVTPWELLVAVAVMLVAIYALVRLAARVYSGALLRSGARASLGDLWRPTRA